VSIEYLDLVDYLAIAAEVTGLRVETITHVAKLDLADSGVAAEIRLFRQLPWVRPVIFGCFALRVSSSSSTSSTSCSHPADEHECAGGDQTAVTRADKHGEHSRADQHRA
jgi:hypothetical protein